MSRVRLALVAGAVAAALASAFAPSAWACSRGYSYAGLYSSRPAVGIAASLSMLELPTVTSGHVAAWVGVGGPGLGPNGADEWLQVGVASFDSSTASLYYELTLPGREPEYVELASSVKPGHVVRVALLELPFAPSTWVVISPAGIAGPFYLPGSHDAWAPVATAESWAAGGSQCNRSSYRFGSVELASSKGTWRRLRHSSKLQDPGWRLRRESASTFQASGI
jgi:hypothetical protein